MKVTGDLSQREALKEGFLLNCTEFVWKPKGSQVFAVRESTSHDLRNPCT